MGFTSHAIVPKLFHKPLVWHLVECFRKSPGRSFRLGTSPQVSRGVLGRERLAGTHNYAGNGSHVAGLKEWSADQNGPKVERRIMCSIILEQKHVNETGR